MTLLGLTRPSFAKLYEKTRKYTIRVDANDATDVSTEKFPVFEEGSLEELLRWRKEFETLVRLKSWTNSGTNQLRNVRLLLDGEALERFEAAYTDEVGEQPLNIARFRSALGKFIERSVPNDAAESIRDYLQSARKPANMSVNDFVTRLKEINRYLPYLPAPQNTSLDEATLFSIVKKSVPSFERAFKANNARQSVTTLSQLTQYYSDLEEIDPPNKRNSQQQSGNKNQKNHGRDSSPKQNQNNKDKKWCHYHKSVKHDWSECSKNPNKKSSDKSSQRKSSPPSSSSSSGHRYQTRSQTSRSDSRRNEESHQIDHSDDATQQSSKTTSKNNNSDDEEGFYHLEETMELANEDSITKHILDTSDYVPETIFAVISSPSTKTKRVHRVLLDTGTSVSLIRQAIIPSVTTLTSDPRGATKWQTRGGTFTTNMVCSLPFQLPEFTPNRTIVHSFRVDPTIKQRENDYDVIIGRDILRKLGLTFDFQSDVPTLIWDEMRIAMRHTWTSFAYGKW